MNDLSLFEHWKQCWTKKFATFNGRARRREYWGFVLFNIVLSWVILILLGFIFFSGASSQDEMLEAYMSFNAVSGLMSAVMLIPSLAAVSRRLHDTGRSAWWFLIAFVPLVGFIVLLVFLCSDSQRGENKWGPNPKEPNLQQ